MYGVVHTHDMDGTRRNSPCNCGCRFIEGEPGRLLIDEDHGYLLGVGLAYYTFPLRNPTGGVRGEDIICYRLDEIPEYA